MSGVVRLIEAKTQTAVKYGFHTWAEYRTFMKNTKAMESKVNAAFDEAAELYAQSKWDEGCKMQKWECERAANFDIPESLSERILNAKTAQYIK